jgi:hypothetical protein
VHAATECPDRTLERLILWHADLIALYATTIRHLHSEVQYRIEGPL